MAMNENLKSVLKKAASGLISASPTLTAVTKATAGTAGTYQRAKTFDKKAAAAAGYSEQEINDYLNEPYNQSVGKPKKNFDVGAAMDSGYTQEEIQQHLQANPHLVAINTPLKERLKSDYSGAFEQIGKSAEEARSGFADVVNPDLPASQRVSGAVYGAAKTLRTGFDVAMTPLAGLGEVPGLKQGFEKVNKYVEENIKDPREMDKAVKKIEGITGKLPQSSREQIKGLLADLADYSTFYALEKGTGAAKSTLKSAPVRGAITKLGAKAEQALKTAAKAKESAIPAKQEAAIAKAATIHREVLRPGKGELTKIEVRKGDNINDYYKLAAEEKLTYSETPDHKLDTRAAVEQLKPKQQQIHEILNEELANNPIKRNSLLKLAEQAKQELEKSIKNADEYEAAAAKVDRYIQSEIKRYGENVNDAQLNNIKQGMWSVSYDQMAPNSQFIARKIGFIAKEIIENNNKDVNIKQLNAMSGKYATLESLLNQAHGRVVQGGSLTKLMAQQAGATAGAAAGLMIPIPVIGPAVGAVAGHLIGGKVSEFMRSPERATSKAGGIVEKAGAEGKSMKDVMAETANQRIAQAGKNMARTPGVPMLEAPKSGTSYLPNRSRVGATNAPKVIPLPKETATTVMPREIARSTSQYPTAETPNIPRLKAAQEGETYLQPDGVVDRKPIPIPRKLESTNIAEITDKLRKKEPVEVYYHGTTPKIAEAIKAEGFKTGAELGAGEGRKLISLGTKEMAGFYKRGMNAADEGALVPVKIDGKFKQVVWNSPEYDKIQRSGEIPKGYDGVKVVYGETSAADGIKKGDLYEILVSKEVANKGLKKNTVESDKYIYHGTPIENAKLIKKEGFRTDANKTSELEGMPSNYGDAIYFSENAKMAEKFGSKQGLIDHYTGTIKEYAREFKETGDSGYLELLIEKIPGMEERLKKVTMDTSGGEYSLQELINEGGAEMISNEIIREAKKLVKSMRPVESKIIKSSIDNKAKLFHVKNEADSINIAHTALQRYPELSRGKAIKKYLTEQGYDGVISDVDKDYIGREYIIYNSKILKVHNN